MAAGAIIVFAAPIIYEVAKHYVPTIGKPEQKIKEKTGLAKIEQEHPTSYAVGMTAAELLLTRKLTPKTTSKKVLTKKSASVAARRNIARKAAQKSSIKLSNKNVKVAAKVTKNSTLKKAKNVKIFKGDKVTNSRNFKKTRSLQKLSDRLILKASKKSSNVVLESAKTFKTHSRLIMRSWMYQRILMRVGLDPVEIIDPNVDLSV